MTCLARWGAMRAQGSKAASLRPFNGLRREGEGETPVRAVRSCVRGTWAAVLLNMRERTCRCIRDAI